MAISTALVSTRVPGDNRVVVADITCDGSYPAGGYLVTPSTFGLSSIDAIMTAGAVVHGTANTLGVVIQWIASTGALKIWKGNGAAALTEVANTDVSTNTVIRVVVFGRS